MTSKSLSIFSPAQLQQLVESTMPADAQPGEKVMVATVDHEGAKAVMVAKLNNVWEVQAGFRAEWDGDIGAGAKVVARWR